MLAASGDLYTGRLAWDHNNCKAHGTAGLMFISVGELRCQVARGKATILIVIDLQCYSEAEYSLFLFQLNLTPIPLISAHVVTTSA